jgi:histone-arginine methyltransferase CARM1
MFPGAATITLCPFSDLVLYADQQAKNDFWTCNSFHGLDMTPLRQEAREELFTQPVVGAFDPALLLSHGRVDHPIDFYKVTMDELATFSIPFQFTIARTAVLHGIATWFDFSFPGTQNTVTIDTGPFSATTHWQQCRLLLETPLAVNASQVISGVLHMTANEHLSYDMTMEGACVLSI